MRRITAGLFISLDGVVEDPQDWHFPYFNDEMGKAVVAQLGAADTLLLGRKTYDSFAGAWPDREAAGGEDAAMGKALGDARWPARGADSRHPQPCPGVENAAGARITLTADELAPLDPLAARWPVTVTPT